ncbi:hypothetical protein C0J52_05261 [Blattella germanica]|nr:hypothetical protein C0J52_05261 [Blattella germanica]
MYFVTSQNALVQHVTRKMATVKVVVFTFLLILTELYGELSSELRKELISRVLSGQVDEKEIRIDYVVFRHLRMLNDSIQADYEIDSNDVTLEFPRTGTVREKIPTRNFNKQYNITTGQNNENPSIGKILSIKFINNKKPSNNMAYRYDYESIKNEINRRDKTLDHNKKVDIVNKQTSDIKQDHKEQIILKNKYSIGNAGSFTAKKSSSSFLDKMVDLLLNFVRFELHETGRDEIVLPNVDESFITKVLYIPITGEFKTEDGWLKNLSTIYRTGEVVSTMSLKSITLKCDLGLKVMEFGYHKYYAELLGIGVRGSMTGSIAADSITIKISLAYVNGSCTAHLDSLKVTRLSGIDVTLTGWDGFGWLLSFIANCVSGSYRNNIITAVEQMLSQTVEEKLKYVNCKHLFPIMS